MNMADSDKPTSLMNYKIIVSDPQMKCQCVFNQFIAINDNLPSNCRGIYVKSEEVKWKGE